MTARPADVAKPAATGRPAGTAKPAEAVKLTLPSTATAKATAGKAGVTKSAAAGVRVSTNAGAPVGTVSEHALDETTVDPTTEPPPTDLEVSADADPSKKPTTSIEAEISMEPETPIEPVKPSSIVETGTVPDDETTTRSATSSPTALPGQLTATGAAVSAVRVRIAEAIASAVKAASASRAAAPTKIVPIVKSAPAKEAVPAETTVASAPTEKAAASVTTVKPVPTEKAAASDKAAPSVKAVKAVKSAPSVKSAATEKLVLEVSELTKSFGTTHAVERMSLSVPAGSIFGIVGPNGAGKTTTLSMISGLLRPDSGTVTVHGANVWKHPAAAKRNMGVLPDRLRLFDRLTGSQLLFYAGTLRGLDAKMVRARTADLASAFGLEDALPRLVSDYSAGMKKKIALASALLHSPRLLVLDEPFESVDPVSEAQITAILQNYVAAGGTVLLSSHSMDLMERICDFVAIVVSGTVLASGTTAEVRGDGSLEERFSELAGGGTTTEGMEWLHSFSD